MIWFSTDNLPYEKVGKNEPVCIADEIPFDIPDSWEWVRIKNLGAIIRGSGIKRNETVERGFPCIRYGEIYTTYNTSFTSTVSFIPEEINEKCKHFSHGDILMTLTGENKPDIAKAVAYLGEEPVAAGGDLAFWTAHGMNSLYLAYLLASPYVISRKVELATGDIIVHISGDKIGSILIPIPPLNEQIRIVEKIQEAECQIRQYSEKEQELTILHRAFPEALKKSILLQAVRGNLVEQDPTDEPAEVLLERIRAEKQRLVKEGKIKKDKHESIIFRRDNSHYEKLDGTERCIDDELPFEIPETWEWIRLGTLFQHNTGKALNASNRDGQKLTYITTSNLYWDRFVLDSLKEMFFTDSEIEKCTVQQGDLLVCEGGDIGRAAIWDYDIPMRIQNHIHRLRAYVPVCTRFFYYLFYLYKGAGWIGGKGIAIQGLSSNAVHNLLFPLPPLKEQFRIVEMIDNTLQIVNAL
jgi:type I restriction enzyme S subunit